MAQLICSGLKSARASRHINGLQSRAYGNKLFCQVTSPAVGQENIRDEHVNWRRGGVSKFLHCLAHIFGSEQAKTAGAQSFALFVWNYRIRVSNVC